MGKGSKTNAGELATTSQRPELTGVIKESRKFRSVSSLPLMCLMCLDTRINS